MRLLARKLPVLMLALAGALAAGQATAQTKPVPDSHPFRQCAGCHSLDTSANAFGPTLIGVYGRQAGSVPRFAYSEAVQKSGVVWNDETLRKWIAGNDTFIPGTRMRHVAITDKAQQDELIEFLKALK
ncbi:c-type cytochrome [Skermanella mucosa]|uniref:c-type cytochrome n=1 Tax=Skermanella mucosa TaxID=1789672 RepID=UPI001E29123C|nr:c-type cytochrome [Skermanella mucosa]UEM21082.1 c-type cytochrome [Skermanella mucosa]